MQEDDSCEVIHLCYEIVDVVVLQLVPKETLQPLNTYCGGTDIGEGMQIGLMLRKRCGI